MKKQQGVSFFGFVIIAVFVAVMLVIFAKVVPTYVEYLNISKAITTISKAGGSPQDIKTAFDKNSVISSIESVTSNDLKIVPMGGKTRVSVTYEKVVPLVGNVSLLFNFDIDKTSGE